MRKRWCLRLAAGALICALTLTGFGLDVPLKFVRQSDRSPFLVPGYGTIHGQTQRPAGDWKLPHLVGGEPLYALVPLGDEKRLMVFDSTEAKKCIYDRLYFDANGNGDLTDDPAINGTLRQRSANYRTAEFSSIDCTIKVDGAPQPYNFAVTLTSFAVNGKNRKLPMQTNIRLRVTCGYVGEFDLNGRRYQVALGDRNANGRFDDCAHAPQKPTANNANNRIMPQGDTMLLTGSGPSGRYERQTLGNRLLLRNKLYDVAIDTVKEQMTLNETRDKLYPARFAFPMDKMLLLSEDDKVSVMLRQPGLTTQLPAGRYRIMSYKGWIKDKQGDTWQVTALAGRESPFVAVDKGNEGNFVFGGPVTVRVDLPGHIKTTMKQSGNRMNFSNVPLEFLMIGAGKEIISSIAHTAGKATKIRRVAQGRYPREPRYKIKKANGKTVTSGKFEYG